MLKYILSVLFSLSLMTGIANARDYIHVVGSSTVYPFTTTVAEQFGKKSNFKTPVVESTGTGGGIKLFCAGNGPDTPDIVNASRKIKDSEIELCEKNGVSGILQITIGYDAIVLAHHKESVSVKASLEDIYKAVAEYIIVVRSDNTLGFERNPNKTWKTANGDNVNIEILGPPPTSGTRDSFIELVMEPICKKQIKEAGLTVSEEDEKKYCKTIRTDGAYIEAGENDNLIVQKLQQNPNAFGIFGYSFLEENVDTIEAVEIDGVYPDFDTVSDGTYPISRELYIYIKPDHLENVSGLKEFVEEYTLNGMGENGYLIDKGLIPK